jgi:hypothetical protein
MMSIAGWRGPFKRHNVEAPLCANPDTSCNAEDPFIWLDDTGAETNVFFAGAILYYLSKTNRPFPKTGSGQMSMYEIC